MRVGVYVASFHNYGKDTAINPRPYLHFLNEVSAGSTPLFWVFGLSTSFPTAIELDSDSVSLTDAPEIIHDYFRKIDGNISKIQRDTSVPALIVYTVEGVNNTFLGSNIFEPTAMPLSFNYSLSIAVDNPNFDSPNFGPELGVTLRAWDDVKEVKVAVHHNKDSGHLAAAIPKPVIEHLGQGRDLDTITFSLKGKRVEVGAGHG